MTKRRLIWHVYPSYFLLAASVLAVGWYAQVAIVNFHRERVQDELASAARLIAENAMPLLLQQGTNAHAEAFELDTLCKTLGRASGYRITIVLPSGKVAGDSEKNPALMENHADRREITDALQKGFGSSIHSSLTLHTRMMYVAIPATAEGRLLGCIRTSLSLAAVDDAVTAMWLRITVVGWLIACMAAFLGIIVSRRISKPLDNIRRGAESIGKGHLAERLPPSDLLEIGILARTMNRMSEQLDERMRTVTQQRDEQNALFACISESVLAVDMDKRLIKANRAAEELFHLTDSSSGRNIVEVIRNLDLLDVIARALESAVPVEGDIRLPEGERYLQAHGTLLHDGEGKRMGALIVLYDVTRLQKLEAMRRDFVSNVSHELKTPITSIKGFIETLIDGAADNKADRDRFLQILDRQASRLAAIVEDLLTLSRLEHGGEHERMEFRRIQLAQVLHNAVESCRPSADARHIALALTCGNDSRVRADESLLEQAVVNLIGNAVKYGAGDSVVDIIVEQVGADIAIRVRDRGPGIPGKHLPRLFERFYRVDKGRSSELGGTGLGLAIVKHIMTLHKGSVTVESEVGQGSEFSLILPMERDSHGNTDITHE